MIKRNGGSKFSVSLRQKLTTPEEVEQFCEELSSTLEDEVRANRTPAFDDFDLSQNSITPEGFDEIFLHLIISEARVDRFKAFGCPALNDAAVSSLSDWLARASGEAMPSEVHLSDCAITSEGFQALARALEENEALPVQDPRDPKRTVPLYVRLERNYIEEAVMRAKAREGSMVTWKKADPMPQDPSVKWRLVVWDSGQFGQHRGQPPPPDTQMAGPTKIPPKVRSPAPPMKTSPKGSPALAVPGTRQPGVLLPSSSKTVVQSPSQTKRVMAPKLPQGAPPPSLTASKDTEQPEDEKVPPEQSAAKPIRPPKQRTVSPPRRVAPKISQPKLPSGPPPQQTPKAVPKPVAPPDRSSAPRPALLTSSTKAPPQPVSAKIVDDDDDVVVNETPRPPSSPPPSTKTVMPSRAKMMAAPKCKVRATPY